MRGLGDDKFTLHGLSKKYEGHCLRKMKLIKSWVIL